MHLLEHGRLSLTKRKHGLTNLLNIKPRVIFRRGSIHRSDGLNGREPTSHILSFDQLVEILISSFPTGIPPKPTVTGGISSTHDIAQSMILEPSSILAK